ncbi:hypothetical protein [Nocardia beijingensis]|uniref:hypothetical protein n=1 Tax=Nocardia beijingensis TaxID=95162 RepID=UPI00082FF6F1|nr:hypothetical protein [Nocardia beijingensis]
MTVLRAGSYVGATATDLHANTTADKAAGTVSQKALFRHRGQIALTEHALTLSPWHSDGSDLVIRRNDIAGITRKYTDLYGRFIGGLLNSGKPLIVATTTAVGEIYLLIDRKEFMESNDNEAWATALNTWRSSPVHDA